MQRPAKHKLLPAEIIQHIICLVSYRFCFSDLAIILRAAIHDGKARVATLEMQICDLSTYFLGEGCLCARVSILQSIWITYG